MSFVYFPYLVFSNISNSVYILLNLKISQLLYLGKCWKGGWECVCVCIPLTPVPRSEVSGGCLPLLLSTLVLRQGPSVNLKLAALTASKLQEASCSASLALGFQTCCPVRLFCGSGVLNSGPRSYTANIFLLSHPQSCIFIISVISFSFLWRFIIMLFLDNLFCLLPLCFSLRLF